MSDKKIFASEAKDLEKAEEKILYSNNIIVCFACGEEIDNSTNICPYCKTTIE